MDWPLSITFDTGALIGLERNRQRARHVLERAKERGFVIQVPAVCIAEWWRKRSDRRDKIFEALEVVQTDDALMKTAGEALAAVPGATTIDAIVMATAARKGGVIYTSNIEDLERLRQAFPSIRVLAV
jgi:predicted nucleic acid-binding protein